MNPSTRCLLGLAFLFACEMAAHGQTPPPANPVCVENCGQPRSPVVGEPVYWGPSPAELERRAAEIARQRQVEANNLNDQGIAAYNNRDWEKACDYFRRALDLEPANRTIRGNLDYVEAQVREELARKQAELEQRQRDARTVVEMRRQIRQLAALLATLAPDATSNLGDGTAPQGARPVPAGLRFMSLDAGEQLKSAAHNGASASDHAKHGLEFMSTPDEIDRAKADSNLTFDTNGGYSGSLDFGVVDARDVRPKGIPSVVANSQGFRRLENEKRILEDRYNELRTELETVRRQGGSSLSSNGPLFQQAKELQVQIANTADELTKKKSQIRSYIVNFPAAGTSTEVGKRQ